MGPSQAEAGEVYAGEEKRTVEGDAVSLEYNPFQDIENHWAKEEILKAYHGGLFQGVTGTKFVPEGKMDRAMFVTVLYRFAGSPAVESLETAFTDVDTARYYGSGCGMGCGARRDQWCKPDPICAAPSHQPSGAGDHAVPVCKGKPEQDVTGQADLSQFVDAGKVAGWAEAAVAWALKEEILEGYPGSYLLPRGSATRAQAAVIFCRYGQL